MRLRDYFLGTTFEMRSPLSPADISLRIKGSVSSSFNPFSVGIVGSASPRRFKLRFYRQIFDYTGKPILIGRLERDANGSRIRLRYRAPVHAYSTWAIYYGVFGLIIVMGFSPSTTSNPELRVSDWVLTALIFMILLVAPFAMHFWWTRRSDEELTEMIDFLKQTIDATPSLTTSAPEAPLTSSRSAR